MEEKESGQGGGGGKENLRYIKEGRAPIKKHLILGKYRLIKRQSLEKYKNAKDWTIGQLENWKSNKKKIDQKWSESRESKERRISEEDFVIGTSRA